MSILSEKGISFILALFALLSIAGCSKKPQAPSGFLEMPDQLAEDKTVPFNKFWYDRKFDFSKVNKMYVAPIDTKHFMNASWLQSLNERAALGQIQKDVEELAEFTRSEFIEAFKNDPQKRFALVNQPGPETLTLEFAIIEVNPSKPALEAAGYFIRGVGLLNQTSIAMEAKFTDFETGKIVMMAQDKESPRIALIADLGKLTWYRTSEREIQQWGNQLVGLCSYGREEALTDPFPFTLIAW
jgi:hypothetical protein